MKKIFYIPFSLILSILLCTACHTESENDLSAESSGIYGVVTDFATGEPVKNANVQLRPTGETTLTGSDGRYEFIDLKKGNYSITVSKAEYTDLIDDYVITVTSKMMRRDLQIEKIPVALKIVDNNLNPLTTLDFGADVSSKQFVIFNDGPVNINCEVVSSCSWISGISTVINPIKPGAVFPVIVTIDRSRLSAGENRTFIHVISNNGNKELEVIAIGTEILPDVTTLPITYMDGSITPWCNTFHAEVTRTGNPAYYQRGFCYSSQNTTPTIDENCIIVPGTGPGKYSYTERNFPPTTTKYYVRAWLKYGNNQIIYGNVQSFVYNDV